MEDVNDIDWWCQAYERGSPKADTAANVTLEMFKMVKIKNQKQDQTAI